MNTTNKLSNISPNENNYHHNLRTWSSFSLFASYSDDIRNEHKILCQQLDEWAKVRKNEIDEHVNIQKQLLGKILDNEIRKINSRGIAVEVTRIEYTRTCNDRQIKELIDECEKLKFTLQVLKKTRPKSVDFIEFEKIENNVQYTEAKTPQNTLLVNSMSPTPSADRRPSLKSQISSSSGLTTSLNSDLTKPVGIDQRLQDFCPKCLMIYPSRMSSSAKRTHENEHRNS